MKKIISRFITKLVYPDGLCCVLCDKELSDNSGLCGKCRPHFNAHFCRRCGNALRNGLQEYCDDCLTKDSRLLFDEARAPFVYDEDNVSRMVKKLKYGSAPYMANIMARFMCETLAAQPWQLDLVTFVPMHPRKERARSYNQARLLAECVAERLKLPVVGTLRKIRHTKVSATKLGRAERVKLLAGSFALEGCDVGGKNILLIDDVLTTKATANECAKMLKLGRVKRVYVLTFATSRGDSPDLYDADRKVKIR